MKSFGQQLRILLSSILPSATLALSLFFTPGIGLTEVQASLSASRPLAVSAEIFLRAARQASVSRGHLSARGPVLWEKGDFKNAEWNRVPEIKISELQSSFEIARNEKFFVDSESRQRRATWLYPDDGCFVRAVVAVNMIEKAVGIKAAKIFAFDNLRVETVNSPTGEVGWWYHVAAITKTVDPVTKTETFHVYDPAIQPKRPLEVREWLKAMNSPNAEIAICSGDSYDPDSDCATGSPSVLNRARNEAQWYLPNEWFRLEELGRDPAQELGDKPPWL